MKCFACNKEIENRDKCPFCGYSFTASNDFSCPNWDEGVCTLTENVCAESDFNYCQVKQEAESRFF